MGLASFVAGATMIFDFFVPACRGIARNNSIASGIGPDGIPAIKSLPSTSIAVKVHRGTHIVMG